MNRLTNPNAQMLFGIPREPVGTGCPSADLAFSIGVAFVATYNSNTMADTGQVVLVKANPVSF